MAVRVVETDFDTKGKTIKAMDRIQRTMPKVFEHALFRWWQRVYFKALQEVPVDTAALRATIRIKRKKSNVGKYNVGRTTDVHTEFMITAGGEGIINPRHKREVDYAEAVHDGTRSNPMGNPFLSRAIDAELPNLEKFLDEIYFKKLYKLWKEGDLKAIPASFGIPLKIFGV